MSGEQTTQTQATEGQNQEAQATQAPAAGSPEAVAAAQTEAAKNGEAAPVDQKPAPEQKPADKAADAASEGTDAGVDTYDAGDDAALGSVYGVFTELGVTPALAEKAFGKAVQTGDIKQIDRQALVAAVGEAKADAAIASATVYYNNKDAAAKAVLKTFDEVAGGEGRWAPIKVWVENAVKTNPQVKALVDQLKPMIGASEAQTKFAAQELIRAFAADPSTKSVAALETGSQLDTSNLQGLGRNEFSRLFQEADRKGDEAEKARLLQRRQLGRAQGIK